MSTEQQTIGAQRKAMRMPASPKHLIGPTALAALYCELEALRRFHFRIGQRAVATDLEQGCVCIEASDLDIMLGAVVPEWHKVHIYTPPSRVLPGGLPVRVTRERTDSLAPDRFPNLHSENTTKSTT